ncbi:MAG TPA: DUF485 domain-containing protein [Thermoanaerobaculia bacterium]|nr:DUF485 domain-containing protein [Thermoanaerobaculia bacterium]
MQTTQEMLDSKEFKSLVGKKWTVSIVLLIVLFVTYYGFILLIAANKPFLAQKIGEFTTLGIPFGVGVILVSWVLTAIYVVWANNTYDVEVQRLKDQVRK